MKSLSVLVTILSLTACPRREDNVDLEAAELAADSTQSTNDEAALLSSMLDGATSGALAITAEQAATAIAARAPARYSPAGCVDVIQSGARLTYTFEGCFGPRGLRALDGTVTLELSIDGDAIVADASATDFRVGLSTLDLDATATYTGTGGSQSLAVVTRTAGVGGLGFEIAHDGDYTVTWTDTCVSLDGSWSSSRGDLARSTVADVSRCIDQCPVGSISRSTVRNTTLDIVFDGSATASWSSSRGGRGTFPLACP